MKETNDYAIYMQARTYLPAYGKFAQVDPAYDQTKDDPESWNLYNYVTNNPVTHTDPDGRIAMKEDNPTPFVSEVGMWFTSSSDRVSPETIPPDAVPIQTTVRYTYDANSTMTTLQASTVYRQYVDADCTTINPVESWKVRTTAVMNQKGEVVNGWLNTVHQVGFKQVVLKNSNINASNVLSSLPSGLRAIAAGIQNHLLSTYQENVRLASQGKEGTSYSINRGLIRSVLNGYVNSGKSGQAISLGEFAMGGLSRGMLYGAASMGAKAILDGVAKVPDNRHIIFSLDFPY